MAVQKQDGLHTDVGVSNGDLTGQEFKFAKRNADGTLDLAGDGEVVLGVISEGKKAGYHTTVNTKGNPILKVIAGGAIARGALVQSGAGGLAKSGNTNPAGRARNAAAINEMVEVEQY